MTLEKLSERTNITPNYLGRVENEQVDPSLSVILAIAQALRAPVGELVDADSEGTSAGDATRRRKRSGPREAREVALLYARLPLDVQEVLLPVLRVMERRTATSVASRARQRPK